MISGKLEITIKINELPQTTTVENGWQQFDIHCGDRIFTVAFELEDWKKLTDAQANHPQWVAVIRLPMNKCTSGSKNITLTICS